MRGNREKTTKEKIKKKDKRTKRIAERAGRKKNDRGVTVTRCSRLLSRHSAWLSRVRSVIAHNRSQIDILTGQAGYRAAVVIAIDKRKCMQCDVTRCTGSLPLSLSFFLSWSISNSPRVHLNREIARRR